ncbi:MULTISPECIES: hypothetical protein [unclassified Kitasatospora]|uniref:hypothetical protein n=1 Tax=unclassified Kitasatospora TaxID=2633591 RepID=UPI00070C8FB0|nr:MULTISPECIES: hypothetical protein [unclassified Kitasatospora]KQV20948.1 hypothetical protein ASC99_20820 [Kitasatospora sp. Root107]KRB60398.1 hypothetical protein ASE03_12360 [Kitasatospora sp. Root187]
MPASLTRLDSRVEAAVGTSIASLHAEEARLSAQGARVLDAHRALTKAETAVAFERVRLLICADRQRRVDDQLLADLSDQLEILEDAAAARDQAEMDLLARVEEMRNRPPATSVPVPAAVHVPLAAALRR